MLTELRVRDLATIADVTLHLGAGLNVLTGETGAGKSMLVDALALLLGERAMSGSVRPGAAKTIVEGAFEGLEAGIRRAIEGLGLDAEDGRVIVRREVSTEGRSRAWANGSPTTAAVLAQLGALLVDLHGQHETQSLLRADAQRDILDAFAHAEPERDAVAEAHAAVASLRSEEASLAARRDEVRRRADYLRHVVREIDQARLRSGEDEALQTEARRLSQAGTLAEQAQRIVDAIEAGEGNALGSLGTADRALANLEKADPEAALGAAASTLSAKRGEAADRLARGVNRLLPRLGLPGGRFRVALASLDAPAAHGQEAVAFDVQLNVGLEAKPLARVASGGEL